MLKRFFPVFLAFTLVFSFPSLASADHGDLVLKVDGQVVETIGGHEYLEAFNHIKEAISEGHPTTCTLDRDDEDVVEDRREAALEDYPADGDKGDRDEYPMAMCEEGGEGASVEYIDPSDNRGMGATIGGNLRDYPDGTKVEFVIVGGEQEEENNNDNEGNEENNEEGNENEDNDGSNEEDGESNDPQYNIHADHTYAINEETGLLKGVIVSAQLKDAEGANGEWTFSVNGKEYKSENGSVQLPLKEAGKHPVTISFNGTVGEEEVKQETTYDVYIPGMDLQYMTKDNKSMVKAQLTNASEAEGMWFIGIADKDNRETIEWKESDPTAKGTSFVAEFDKLEPGEYIVGAIFAGEVDGKPIAVQGNDQLTIDSNGGGYTEPIDDEKDTVKDSDRGQKIIDDSKEGGKLPETAIDSPLGMLFGFLIVIAGGVLLWVRRLT